MAGKWFWREIGRFFVVAGKFYYDRKKKVPVFCLAGCAVVSVFGSNEYDRKKKLQSSVWRVVLLCQFLVLAGNWQFCCCGGKVLLRPEKKRYCRLSGGCAIIITTRKKKDTVLCLVGARSLLRPEKKDSIVCLAGARSLL